MNLFNAFRDDILACLASLTESGQLPSGLDSGKVTAEPPRDSSHGDVATNAAMVLGKQAAMAPKVLAERLAKAWDTVVSHMAVPGGQGSSVQRTLF